MGIDELWRRSEEVIREEHDERTEIINLRVTCAVLAAVSLCAFGAIILLVLLPLSNDQRFVGLGLTPLAMLIVGAVVDNLAGRRHGPSSRELQRAVGPRALLLGLPVLAGLTGGLAELATHGRPEQAVRTALALLLGGVIGFGVHLWLLKRT